MAGIYIHIPFCKQACHYCDFHFSTSLQYKNDLLLAIAKEIKLQRDYLGGENIETIYFGGGTPSLLSGDEVSILIEEIQNNFKISNNPEITLEANPDDLNLQKLREFGETPINRFSIGVQSFFDEDLKWMNRAHHAKEAESAIKRAQDFGFENLTIDLIYGFPLLSDEKWNANIEKAINFQIPHVSSYNLTVEPKTALAKLINIGKEKNVDDAQSATQFQVLMEKLGGSGFEHYEISNFAKPNQYAKHNTNYWKGVSYLGLGPSAHSFNRESRQWNVANNAKYLAELNLNKIPFEKEILSNNDKFNEYLMTSLRTMWGIDLSKISTDFGTDYKSYLMKNVEEFLEKEQLTVDKETIKLTKKGKLYADAIAAELFITEDGFKNKIVWITGASSGIGEALVYALNQQGAKLIISSRKAEGLYKVKQKCKSNPLDVHVLPIDLEQKQTLFNKAEEAWKIYGRIDILINGGGISQRSTVIDTQPEVEEKIMNTNYWGTVYLSKALLPKMLEQGTGHLVIISSLVGKFGTQFRSSYAASKHALHGYFDSLRCEVYNKGIDISMICPGYIKTNVSVNAMTAKGGHYGLMDVNQENGMLASVCASKILEAVAAKKEEVLIGGKEKYGVFVKRFLPKYFSRMIRKRKVT